jgi:GT2 family glycosyltransferase
MPSLALIPASQALAADVDNVFGPLGMRAEPIAQAERLPAVRIHLPGSALATDILIPTRDRLDLLKPCLETLMDVTRPGPWRVWVIDNGSREPETLAYLREFAASGRGEVIKAPGPFNYARINNLAVALTSSPLLCFLNNDVEITDPDWLETMGSCLWSPEVAGVGARLLWPSGVVQHGGVILGTGFAAAHGYDHHLATDAGFADGLLVEREGSAMTAACLLMRRAEFDAVGGFDERAFPVAFNDVDLCLKLRARGRRLIWTPHATLIHKESQSRGREDNPEKERRARRELENLRSRWGDALAADPYYHPCLNLNSHPFSGLAMPPGPLAARRNLPPAPSR